MLHTSVVCLMEIRIGIENLANKAAAASLSNWLENVLGSYFEDRILPLGEDVLVDALKLATRAHRKRRGAPLADVLIAATARVHDLTVVTRNTRDFMGLEVPLLNVWTGKAFEGT
jgi:toxin FitB